MASVALIVGLGNPGAQYEATRHNAGFWFVDELARRHGGQLRHDAKLQGEVGRIKVEGHELWLLKPMTFMNRSGQSVAGLARFYKIEPGAIVVAHDELDLPPGQLRLKQGGGHGGHNGLRDITAQLGADFFRLRIGIGHPGHASEVTGWVLGRPPADDRITIDRAIEAAVLEVPTLIAGDTAKAMNRLHSRKEK